MFIICLFLRVCVESRVERCFDVIVLLWIKIVCYLLVLFLLVRVVSWVFGDFWLVWCGGEVRCSIEVFFLFCVSEIWRKLLNFFAFYLFLGIIIEIIFWVVVRIKVFKIVFGIWKTFLRVSCYYIVRSSNLSFVFGR